VGEKGGEENVLRIRRFDGADPEVIWYQRRTWTGPAAGDSGGWRSGRGAGWREAGGYDGGCYFGDCCD